jgi:cytosine deaminase
MNLAIEEAKKAESRGSVPVGAVIVRDDQVISTAGNEVIKNLNPIAHAEILAIHRACLFFNSSNIKGCDIYVTLEPCAMCAQAISMSRVRRLYFGAYDIKYGAIEKLPYILDYAIHKTEVVGGVLETQCVKILQNFFIKKRF